MRLQRVVFGALAVVLVCLFALGLSAYREMQRERDSARLAEADALAKSSLAENRAVKTERQQQQTSTTLRSRERELALSKCRLAMVEVRDGNVSRAAGLLSEASALGLPRWSPLVQRLTRDAPARFDGSEYADRSVLAGAVSGNGKVIAIVRLTGDGAVVERWSVGGGEMLDSSRPVSPVPDFSGQNARLLLSDDGSKWFLPLPQVSFYGSGGVVTPVFIDRWAKDAPLRDIVADRALSVIYIIAEQVIRLDLNAARQWGISPYTPADGALAICLAGAMPVFATPEGVFQPDSAGEPVPLHLFDTPPDRVTLRYGAGAVFAGVLEGRSLRLIALTSDPPGHLATSRHDMPDDFCEDLLFLRDDTLVWVGRSGRVFTVGFAGKREWTLGGYTVTFVERHPQGLVFANRRGEFSVRVQDELRLLGIPVHAVPPGFVPEAHAHGFVLKSADANQFVVQGEVLNAGPVLAVALAPQGPCWRDESTLRLPGGSLSSEPGVLLGALSDGSAVLHDSPRKLKLVSSRGVTERLLPVDRVPESVVVAGSARVVAMRIRDNVYVTDFSADPEPVANRLQASPDLLALDATGARLAIAYGPTIVVQRLSDGAEFTVRTNAPPRQIALLFGGTVLATTEAGSLVLYEVETGRELLRGGANVSSIAAAGERALNIVAANFLHELRWD